MQELDASGGFWGATNRASVLVTRHIDYTSHWLQSSDAQTHIPILLVLGQERQLLFE